MIVSLVGYLASVLLGISLLVNNDLRFRWLNTFGCLTFVVYGALIGAYPIILTNAALFLINVFYLVKIYRTEEEFDLLEFKDNDQIIEKFLQFHQQDIKGYFPTYHHKVNDNDISFVVLRDMVIANIFVATLSADGSAFIRINYTVPKYRDYKVGRFIFEHERKYLQSKGIKKLVYEHVGNKNHLDFIKKMGFVSEAASYKKLMIKHLV